MERYNFKVVEQKWQKYWDDNEINDSWTDNYHWSLYHNSWWFPPNLFVLNVDETKKYSFINWLTENPMEVKE